MDILGALKKLIGVGQPQQNAQPARPQQHMPVASPYPRLTVGVIDKPTVKPKMLPTPSALHALLPNNLPAPKYEFYVNPKTGDATVENDNALPGDPNASSMYMTPKSPVDSPHPLTGFRPGLPVIRSPQYQYRSSNRNNIRSI